MKRKSLLTGIFVLAVAGCAGLKHDTNENWPETLHPIWEICTSSGRNAYFVLEPGYQLFLAGLENGKKTELTITVLDETKNIGGMDTRVIEERETVNGRLAEVSRNYLAIGSKSKNIYYFGEDVDIYKTGNVSHEGSWGLGAGVYPGILMPGQIKVGDRYYQEKAPEQAMDRAENVATNVTVTTPAGRFDNCLKTKETTPLESGTEYKYYAPGIGLVQEGSLKLMKYGRAVTEK